MCFEINIYLNSNCLKSMRNYYIYFEFAISLLIKILILNHLNLEFADNNNMNIFKALIPNLLWGSTSILVLPILIYDFDSCQSISLLISIKLGFDMINYFILIHIYFFLVLILYHAFLFLKIKYYDIIQKIITVIFLINLILYLLVLNVLFNIITFTQITKLLPIMYFDNFVYYWILIRSLNQLYIIKKIKIKYKI